MCVPLLAIRHVYLFTGVRVHILACVRSVYENMLYLVSAASRTRRSFLLSPLQSCARVQVEFLGLILWRRPTPARSGSRRT